MKTNGLKHFSTILLLGASLLLSSCKSEEANQGAKLDPSQLIGIQNPSKDQGGTEIRNPWDAKLWVLGGNNSNTQSYQGLRVVSSSGTLNPVFESDPILKDSHVIAMSVGDLTGGLYLHLRSEVKINGELCKLVFVAKDLQTKRCIDSGSYPVQRSFGFVGTQTASHLSDFVFENKDGSVVYRVHYALFVREQNGKIRPLTETVHDSYRVVKDSKDVYYSTCQGDPSQFCSIDLQGQVKNLNPNSFSLTWFPLSKERLLTTPFVSSQFINSIDFLLFDLGKTLIPENAIEDLKVNRTPEELSGLARITPKGVETENGLWMFEDSSPIHDTSKLIQLKPSYSVVTTAKRIAVEVADYIPGSHIVISGQTPANNSYQTLLLDPVSKDLREIEVLKGRYVQSLRFADQNTLYVVSAANKIVQASYQLSRIDLRDMTMSVLDEGEHLFTVSLYGANFI